MAGNPDFDLFKLGEEHDELRAAIRALCEKEIAPYAKEVDEKARFPEEARVALVNSGFNAIHVPEEYDGQGADSVAACIVIEEVARVCGSSSLIPAVNKLGTMGLILKGSDELKRKVLPSIADGSAMASYALSEREAGSDAAAMRTRARRDGDDWILNGSKCWITNGANSAWFTVMAVSDPDKGANGISAFMVHVDDEGFTVGPKEHKLGIKGSPTNELYFEQCRIPGDRMIGAEGTGFKTALDAGILAPERAAFAHLDVVGSATQFRPGESAGAFLLRAAAHEVKPRFVEQARQRVCLGISAVHLSRPCVAKPLFGQRKRGAGLIGKLKKRCFKRLRGNVKCLAGFGACDVRR